MPFSDQLDRVRLSTQLQTISELTDEQRSALSALPMRTNSFAAGADIASEEEVSTHIGVILSGLAARYKIVGDGKRQILSLHLPGDVPDSQSLYLDHMDHGLVALSPCRVGFVAHDAVRDLVERDPKLGAVLIKQAMIDGSIFREWIANVGRRQGLTRVAHLFCELFVRLRVLGLSQDNVILLPLTQSELGDATGMSAVHVNRVMQQLRAARLLSSRGNQHTVVDWPGLRRVGDFSPAYLHLRLPVLSAAMGTA